VGYDGETVVLEGMAFAGESLEPGAHIGNYEVIRELGRGGMGVVYLVRHELTGDKGFRLVRRQGEEGGEKERRDEEQHLGRDDGTGSEKKDEPSPGGENWIEPVQGDDEVEMRCPVCGKAMQPTWKVCPFCGGRGKEKDVPTLPEERQIDHETGFSKSDKLQAESLLVEFQSIIDDIVRINANPPSMWTLLTKRKTPGLSEAVERGYTIRDQIYEILGARLKDEDFESPYSQMLRSYKQRRPDLDEYVSMLRNEIRYIRQKFKLERYGDSNEDEENREANRFICPGCGEKATAKNASLCPRCKQYVHHDCAVKGFVRWTCPVCGTGLVGQS